MINAHSIGHKISTREEQSINDALTRQLSLKLMAYRENTIALYRGELLVLMRLLGEVCLYTLGPRIDLGPLMNRGKENGTAGSILDFSKFLRWFLQPFPCLQFLCGLWYRSKAIHHPVYLNVDSVLAQLIEN